MCVHYLGCLLYAVTEFILIYGFMLQALDKCRESPPDDWPAPAYVLVGREDLATAKMGSLRKENGFSNNDSSTSISVPYMLHLQPVTVPTTASDAPTSEVLNSEDTDAVYRSVEDGMEHIFTSTTQLRYGRDLRLNEVCSVFYFFCNKEFVVYC
jgi:anaphase-promoting complex subunit 1